MLIHAVCFCRLYDSWSIHAAPIRSAINGSSKGDTLHFMEMSQVPHSSSNLYLDQLNKYDNVPKMS